MLSPYALIEQYKNPALRIHLIHGEPDTVAPVEESVKIHNALQAAGYDSTLAIFPNWGHEFHFALSEGKQMLKAILDIIRD